MILLGNTSWWGDEAGVAPIVKGVLGDPGKEEAYWQSVSGDVLKSIDRGLSGQLPEGWEIHF